LKPPLPKKEFTIIDFYSSGIFPDLGDMSTWELGWFPFHKAFYGLPMDDRELAVYQKCTGRPDIPQKEFPEAWVISGRRSGKTRSASHIMLYEALRRDHREYAVGGENPRGIIIATDRQQAGEALGYMRGTLEESEYLRPYMKENFKE
jgi:hypothetical protein